MNIYTKYQSVTLTLQVQMKRLRSLLCQILKRFMFAVTSTPGTYIHFKYLWLNQSYLHGVPERVFQAETLVEMTTVLPTNQLWSCRLSPIGRLEKFPHCLVPPLGKMWWFANGSVYTYTHIIYFYIYIYTLRPNQDSFRKYIYKQYSDKAVSTIKIITSYWSCLDLVQQNYEQG